MSFEAPNEIGKKYPEAIISFKKEGNIFTFISSNVKLKLQFLTDDIINIRYCTELLFPKHFSYALVEKLPNDVKNIEFIDQGKYYILTTSTLRCFVEKDNLKLLFKNLAGATILEDEAGFHWEENLTQGGSYQYCSKVISPFEKFFGLGDKPMSADLRKKKLTIWGTDRYGFENEQDPIYRSIPFYYGLHEGIGYGVFFDNSFKTYFDFGFESENLMSFWADGGEMNYYFINGPELIKVAERYVSLTGTPELPPLWALGYHQCKWSYYPDSKVREIANEFRSREIPCDAIYLDIDYMEGFRCFTWNKNHFPNPQKLLSDLKKDGFNTVVIIDPGIKCDPEYYVWQEGVEKDLFCRRGDGDYMKGAVWPGYCYFPDFTKKDSREWWATLFKTLTDVGVSGIWNDMNEPAVFGYGTFPDDVRHDYDSNPCSHRKAHNVYGMQMARATYEGLKLNLPEKRPFNITRSGFSGFQRYASVWTGDNIATWEHLWLANMQCQRLSISGVSFCGTDIGGFIGEPNGELFVRWIQMSVFHPFFRGHSSGDRGEKEPWVFGPENEKIAKKYIELRYKLLPYIYTTFWQHIKNGTPMIRPLVFISQTDYETHHREDEFGFGDHLLVCPIAYEKQEARWMYLPQGIWYNYWDDTQYTGGVEIWVNTPLDTMPIFVRAGALLPNFPIMQYTNEKKIDVLDLHYYLGQVHTKSVWYEDKGEGYEYLENKCLIHNFESTYSKNSFTLKQILEGDFKPEYKFMKIHFHGLTNKSISFNMDGETIKSSTNEKGLICIEVKNDFKLLEFKLK